MSIGERLRPGHGLGSRGCGALEQSPDTIHDSIEHGLIACTVPHRVDDDPVGLRWWHFDIKPGHDRRHAIHDRSPIGDHQAVESPLLTQERGEETLVLTGIHAVDLVVGAHQRPRTGLLDGHFEGRQVDLTQGALIHFGTHAEPIGFLVVHGEVLGYCADAL